MSEETKQSANLPALRPPRLPYHPKIEERFGYDKSDWKALVEAIFPLAQEPESVILALSYCKARKLDPFKRCVHIVPIWDSKKKCTVDTIWPGIGELRTTAHRTGAYAGRDKTELGPMVKQTWGGKEVEFPSWAQVTVYRIVRDQRVAYAGPQVYWLETFASVKDGSPNSMWSKRPRGQLDKCAEAAALRAAFPEEVGNDYIAAEAHSPGAPHKNFEQAQNEATNKILDESGSDPIDTKFEENGNSEGGDDPEATFLEKPEETEKGAVEETGEPQPPKTQFKCKQSKCKHKFEVPEPSPKGEPLCPKCLSPNIKEVP